MTSLTTATWSPSSYQLKFNFKFRKSQTPLLFARARASRLGDRRGCHRAFCVAQNGEKRENGSESQKGNSWDNSNSNLNDWSSSEQPGDSRPKQGIAGIVGVGFASIFLVSGITFAAMSIGKRSNSRSRQEMESLTQQQEAMLASEEEVYRKEGNKSDRQFEDQDRRILENDNHLPSRTDLDSDLSSSLESTEDVGQSISFDYPAVDSLSEHEKSPSDAHGPSTQDPLLSDSMLRDVNEPETPSASPQFSLVENVDDTYVLSSSMDIQDTQTEADLNDVGMANSETDAKHLGVSDQLETLVASETSTLNAAFELSSSASVPVSVHFQAQNSSAYPKSDTPLEIPNVLEGDLNAAASISTKEAAKLQEQSQFSGDSNTAHLGIRESEEDEASGIPSSVALSSEEKQDMDVESDDVGKTSFESQSAKNPFTPIGIPAPSLLSAALHVPPGKVLVPAVVDQTQGQALAALQVLKVIESDSKPGDLCTRREYARWLVSASSALSRNSISKVYPAMYIENVTELAFDDITPEDPDFTSIQGLAEAGLISSKLSRRDMLSSQEDDMGSFYFHPDSPLSRQDLVSWKMALEKRQLPEADRKILHQISGFIDIDKINPDAWPALVADLSAGEQGIVALAFGYTKLFQPNKPVTKGQAAIALATGEAADIVSEELARIEAESIAENAVAAHNALVAEVEKDVNANFEQELLLEREKIDAMQKMAEEAKKEVDRLRGEREADNVALMKERATIESEMEVLSRLRHDLEEQLQSLVSNKVEISFEKERIEKLRKETEEENQAIARLQYELEVERKALSMARAWAEDEARRVQEHAKALEEARDRWERQGIKVVVDEDLREEASTEATWVNVGKKLSVDETVERAETLTDKLKVMAGEVKGKSKEIINKIIEKIQLLISSMKEWISEAGRRTTELRDVTVAKVDGSVQELQQNVSGFGANVKEGAKRVVEDCRGGVERLTQRFKT